MPTKSIPYFQPDPSGQINQFVPTLIKGLWIEGDIKSFRKCPDQIIDYFVSKYQGQGPLIKLAVGMVWLKLTRLAINPILYSVRDLAGQLDLNPETYTLYLDELEDVELIKRFRCVDTHGQPNYVGLCSPPKTKRLFEVYPRLLKQRVDKATASERTKATKAGQLWPSQTLKLKDALRAEARRDLWADVERIYLSVIQGSVGRASALDDEEIFRKVYARCHSEKIKCTKKELREALTGIEASFKL